MNNLFLTSYFSAVAPLLPDFYGNNLEGVNVVFIPTASVVEKVTFYIGADKKALGKLGCVVDELEISTASQEVIERTLTNAEIIFIDGGNTFFLLQELRRTGADKLIKEHVRKGKLYIGASAGSMIAGPTIEYVHHMDNPKKGPELNGDFSGLGVVNFSIVPHCINFPFKKAVEKIIENYSDSLELKPIHNKQVITVKGDIVEILHSS